MFLKVITEEYIQISVQKIVTTAVEDIERNAPTNTPSEGLPPHNWKICSCAALEHWEKWKKIIDSINNHNAYFFGFTFQGEV